MAVEKEVEAFDTVCRIVVCPCGSRFETAEKIGRRLPSKGVTPNRQLVSAVADNVGQIDVIPNAKGGRGGSGSGLSVGQTEGLSLVGLPSKSLTRARVGRGGRGGSREYPPEFEAVLAACPGWRGHKGAAHDAWVKQGKPGQHVISDVYVKWKESDQWRRGFVPHLSTWLNAGGWEKEPNADELAGPPVAATVPLASPDVRREAFRAQTALDARLARVKGMLGDRRAPVAGNPVTDLVQHLADQKGVR